MKLYIALFFNCLIIESSAFVYGTMTFVDRVSCGAAFIAIQNGAPIKLDPCEDNCDYFQWVLVSTCGGASVLGLLVIAVLYPMTIGKR